MATKKPIVIGSNGLYEQLQAGDTLGISSETGQVTLQATSGLVPGNVVYTDGAGSVDLARANASGTTRACGLAAETISGAASGVIQTNGVLALTTGEWDAITGGSGGLTPGADYFLSAATAGLLTTTAPTTAGQYNVPIGTALSTTEFLIEIARPTKL